MTYVNIASAYIFNIFIPCELFLRTDLPYKSELLATREAKGNAAR